MAIEKCNINLGIILGERFSSFQEADTKIEQLTSKNFVQYYRRDSRTIEAAKRKTKRYLNPNLQYYQIKYACIHGGRKHVPAGKGLRNRKTFRNEEICPANVVLRISDSGNELEVIKIENEHNHRVDRTLFSELPHQRNLPPEIRENAKKLLKIKANKHLLRQQLEDETQKVIKLKDLSNLQQENKRGYQNSIETVCRTINTKYGTDCHLLVEGNEFRGLIFCTPGMISMMNAYPEMICIDATYKLLKIRAPVFLILVEDGCGECEIVTVCILTKEDKASLKWMLSKFKEINLRACEIKNVMADKDWLERDVLQECFPEARILICIFHVFKIFNREITGEKMRITSSQRNLALTLLQNMVYARNQTEFDKIKSRMENELPKTVIQYLENNWFNISEEWCPRLGTKVMNFMNTTNNRLESINAKLKSVISLHSSLEEFIENLFVIIKSLEKERRSRLAHNINKRIVSNFPVGSAEHRYSKLVSEYAFKHLITQFKYVNMVKILLSENRSFKVASLIGSEQSYQTTSDSCECFFATSMGLPCKHIFAVRLHLGEGLYNEGLVHQRWTLAYILDHQIIFPNSRGDNSIEPNVSPAIRVESVTPQAIKVLSQQEKYKLTLSKAKCIAHLAAEFSTRDFNKILSAMDTFIDLLEENKCDIDVTYHGEANGLMERTEPVENNTCHNVIIEEVSIDALVENEDNNVYGNRDSSYLEDNGKIAYQEDENQLKDKAGIINTLEVSLSEEALLNAVVEVHTNYSSCTACEAVPSIEETMSQCEQVHVQKQGIENHFKENSNSDLILDNAGHNHSSSNSNLVHLINAEHDYNYSDKVHQNSDSEEVVIVSVENDENIISAENEIAVGDINLCNITVPPVFRKRGRPAGSNLTAIGLPSKRKRKLVPFMKLPKQERVNQILSWVVQSLDATKNRTVTTSDLKDRNAVDIRVTEVSLSLVKICFEDDAYQTVQQYKSWLSQNGTWICPACEQPESSLMYAGCSKCLKRYHISCVNTSLSNVGNNVNRFFCRNCR